MSSQYGEFQVWRPTEGYDWRGGRVAESTGLLNLHTGNRITSSNLVLSAQCNQQGRCRTILVRHFCMWPHLPADCSRTVRDVRRRPAPEQISSVLSRFLSTSQISPAFYSSPHPPFTTPAPFPSTHPFCSLTSLPPTGAGDVPKFCRLPAKPALFAGDVPENGTSPAPGAPRGPKIRRVGAKTAVFAPGGPNVGPPGALRASASFGNLLESTYLYPADPN